MLSAPTVRQRVVEALCVLAVLAVCLGTVVAVAVWSGPYFPHLLGGLGLVAVLLALGFRLHRRWILRRFRLQLGGPDKVALVVMTESPHWADHIRGEWMPRLGSAVVLLNRSEPRSPDDLRVRVWRAFAGPRNHTPLAIVFGHGYPPAVFRFFPAFTEHKHGKSASLRSLEKQFFEAVERAKPGAA